MAFQMTHGAVGNPGKSIDMQYGDKLKTFRDLPGWIAPLDPKPSRRTFRSLPKPKEPAFNGAEALELLVGTSQWRSIIQLIASFTVFAHEDVAKA